MEKADKALFRAIDRQDTVGVKAAMADGANLDARRKHNTPLLDAVFSKNTEIVALLARAGAQMMQVQDSRDPMTAAFNQADLPTVAALLDAPATPQGLAAHLARPDCNLLGERQFRSALLRQSWKDTFQHLVPLLDFSNPGTGRRWWASACDSYSPDVGSIRALQHHVWPERDASLFRALADNGAPVCVLQVMQEAGHLDVEMMFHAFMGKGKGFLEAALAREYNLIPNLKWLVRQAVNLPDGRNLLAQRWQPLMALSLGKHASMPLAMLLSKAIDGDAIEMAAQARMPDGSTTIHLLLEGHQDIRRRLALCRQLMEAGADPMTPNSLGFPACYRACMIDGFGCEPLEIMGAHGADLAPGGLVEERLARDTQTYAHIIQRAQKRLRIYQVESQHDALQKGTATAPSRKSSHRL